MGEKRAPQGITGADPKSKSLNSNPVLTVDVSLRVSPPVKDAMNKRTLGGKGFIYLTLGLSVSLREVRSGTWKQELGVQRPRRNGNGAYLLAPHGLLNLFSDSIQDYLPKGGSTHSAMGPPTSILKKAPPQASLVGTLFQ